MIRKTLLALAMLLTAVRPVLAQSTTDVLGIATNANTAAAAAQTTANTAISTRMWKNLSDFGVQYGVNADQSTAVNAAFASGYAINCTGTVYVNNTLILTNTLVLQGSGPAAAAGFGGRHGCLFQAMTGMTADMVHTAAGVQFGLTIRDVQFNGVATNTGQNGVMLIATVGTNGQGGMWYSSFENVFITNFDGISLGLIGNCALGVAPHQWLSFKTIQVTRANSTSGAALYATGEVEHVHFDSSQFDGPTSSTAVDIYLGESFATTCTGIGAYGTGTVFGAAAGGAAAPVDWKFTNPSIQDANQAVILDAVQEVTFENAWVEQTGSFILAQNGARASVINSHPTNAAIGSPGYLVYIPGCAEVEWINTHAVGNVGSGFSETTGCGSVHASGNIGNMPFSNMVVTSANGSTTIKTPLMYTLYGMFTACTVSGAGYNGFFSDLAPGQLFEIKISGSSAYPCLLTTSGSPASSASMNLGNGVTSVTLNAGDTAVLMRSAFPSYGWEYLGKH